MKSFLIYATVIITTFTACNSENKNTTSDTSKASSTENPATTNKAITPDAIDARAAALEKLKPLSLDQLKAILPEEIEGKKRSDFSGLSTGVAFASAKYITDEATLLEITLQDCGGKAGPGIYKTHYAIVNNAAFATENENGYLRTIDFMGVKATESYDKNSNLRELSYIANDRVLVTIKGKNIPLENIKQAAQNLKF